MSEVDPAYIARILHPREQAKLGAYKAALLPQDISWRIADKFERLGLVTINRFWRRWQGRSERTPLGDAVARILLAKLSTPAQEAEVSGRGET